MGTHFRFGTGTACGVNGKREFHERIAAITKGVVLTRLNPRELKRSETDTRLIYLTTTADNPEPAQGMAQLELLWK